jgi:hypothetical protein
VKYLGVVVAVGTVPLLVLGMAMIGARVYSVGSVTLIDIVGFALQIMVIVLLVLAAIVLWKKWT